MHGRTAPLLLLGVAAAALYTAIVDIGAQLTPGYSHVAQPVSSLYQSGAPLGPPIAVGFALYNVLVVGFGCGVMDLASSGTARRAAGIAGGIMIALVGVAGAIDDVFPQDPFGAAITTSGILHVAFAGVASVLTVVAMALLAWWASADRSLRPLALFSAACLVVILISGPVTAAATAGGSPVMGLLERITIFSFTVWMAVASVALARRVLAGTAWV